MVEKLGGIGEYVKEGEKEFKKGEKAIATGLFKWSPDYLEGASRFQKAAKIFQTHGNEKRAIEAYVQYSKCSEQSNEMLGAGEGLQEAAFLSKDYKQSVEWLLQADTFYKIGGYADRGISLLKRFANELIERDTEESKRNAFEIYEKTLMDMVFANEDNYLMNGNEVVTSYLTLQIEQRDYEGAIRTKKRFMDYLRSQRIVDHQIRRSWLEVICLQVLLEDFYRIDESLNLFANDCPGGNAYNQDEYLAASDLHEAIKIRDFEKAQVVLRKPIFSYIEIEVVKPLKRLISKPPAHLVAQAQALNQQQDIDITPQNKDQALDELLT